MPDNALDLARLQFAFTISFHIILPAFTIGLASYLAVLEGLWLWTSRDVFIRTYRFWIKVFALAVSSRNSHTQIGPSRTSAKDNRASSAAGRLREPSV